MSDTKQTKKNSPSTDADSSKTHFPNPALRRVIHESGYTTISTDAYPTLRTLTVAFISKVATLARDSARERGRKTIYVADLLGDEENGIKPVLESMKVTHFLAGAYEKDGLSKEESEAVTNSLKMEFPTKTEKKGAKKAAEKKDNGESSDTKKREIGDLLAQSHVRETAMMALKVNEEGCQIAKDAKPVLQMVAEQALVNFLKSLIPITTARNRIMLSLTDITIALHLYGLLPTGE